MTLAMVGELVLIAMQAGRGVPSHFNETTPCDAAVFSAMGAMIAANTLAAFVLLVRAVFTPDPLLPRAALEARSAKCEVRSVKCEVLVLVLVLGAAPAPAPAPALSTEH